MAVNEDGLRCWVVERAIDRRAAEGKRFVEAKRMAKADLAKRLQKEATAQESRLKAWLDTKPLGFAWKFQSVLRGYICDFRCVQLKTIIEVDGAHHNEEDDAIRDGVLWRAGYQTIRFTNSDVDSSFADVQARITAAIRYELDRLPAKG